MRIKIYIHNYIHIVTVVTIICISAYHYCHGYFSHHLQLTLFNLTIIIGLSNIVLHEIDIVFISFLYLKFRPIIYLPSTCRKYLCNLNLFEACQKKSTYILVQLKSYIPFTLRPSFPELPTNQTNKYQQHLRHHKLPWQVWNYWHAYPFLSQLFFMSLVELLEKW